MSKLILVAGATGRLGEKITHALLKTGERIGLLARSDSDQHKIKTFEALGAKVHIVDFRDVGQVSEACQGATCLVSAISGLRDAVVNIQTRLVAGAIRAGVPRFIPSDYSLDFTQLQPGTNRNLDWRREFHQIVEGKSIRLTTIFNGAFMDLLDGDMPLILPKVRRILHWGDARIMMDMTTMDDVAEYTAQAALDNSTPRYLHIAGDRVSAASLARLLSSLQETAYKPLSAGSISQLNKLIAVLRFFSKNTKNLYPAWQGMQYMRDMMEGRAVISLHDNDRYPKQWTDVKSFLIQQGIV